MPDRDDPYGVLGLEPGADDEQVRGAHRRLVKALHPDVGGSRLLFEQVQQAYRELSDGVPARPAAVEPTTVRPPRTRLLAELRAKSRGQWLVEALFAAQLTIAGTGSLVVLLS